jgi:hypothetical protein
MVVTKDFIEYAEKKLSKEIVRFDKSVEVIQSRELAKQIVAKIDWENSALMHKGFSWIAKTYLKKIS